MGTERGSIVLPLAVTDLPDRVVWVPTNSPGSAVRRQLGVDAGALVWIARSPSGPAEDAPAPEASTNPSPVPDTQPDAGTDGGAE